MRKYSRLKESYYETEFIGDDDSKVGFDVDIPSDLTVYAPVEAYFAFIDCIYDGDFSQGSLNAFLEAYEGNWGPVENFVEHYFEDIDTDEEWEDAKGIEVFDEDRFYDCVDFRSLGQSVKEWYEDNIKEYLINSELPEDEEESFYVEYLSDDMDISSSSDYEIGMAYVMAVAEREDISYREAVRWIDKNKKKILHWDWGIPFINDSYYYTDGFYFNCY